MEPLVVGGPFSTVEGKTLSRESRGYYERAIVTTRAGAAIVEALLRYGLLSRSQASLITGYSQACAPTLKTLWTIGYVDKLVTGSTPALYCAGPAMRSKYGLRKQEWRLPEVFRLAAANQLAAQLKARKILFGYEVSGEAAETAVLTLGNHQYAVLAPRICPGEEQWCREAIYTYTNDARIIVIAATEAQAAEISEYLYDVGPQVRFTWDAVLKERVAFFRRERNTFVLEKEY